ncbi:MAG: hypothetical protein AABW51_00205 [Nanoarchaeota archaeon]
MEWYNLILAIFGIIALIFFAYKTLVLPPVNSHLQEAIQNNETKNIEYIIISDYKSKGGFIANNKIESKIKIISREKDFREIKDIMIWFGGINTNAYVLPIEEEGGYGMRKSPIASLSDVKIDNSYKTLETNSNFRFDIPGEYPPYYIRLEYKDGTFYNWHSSKKIVIEPHSRMTELQNYRLTAIALLIAIIGIFVGLKFSKN